MADRVSLASLLPERLDSVAERIRPKLCENEDVDRMKLAWGFIGSQLLESLKSVLDCDLLEVLAKAWAEAAPLAELADPARHPPGERSLVELGEHEISRQLEPVVAVTIGPCPCVELRFQVTITAHVGGVRLSVVDGHITGGDPGELWASAALSFEGVPLHPAQESRRIALPGQFSFSPPGIRIPRLAAAAAPAEGRVGS